jgi:hypothetical protein
MHNFKIIVKMVKPEEDRHVFNLSSKEMQLGVNSKEIKKQLQIFILLGSYRI